jgi:hypothetical protein
VAFWRGLRFPLDKSARPSQGIALGVALGAALWAAVAMLGYVLVS